MAHPDREQLSLIADLIDRGRVQAHVDSVYPLDQIAAAESHLEKDHVRGKVVLQIGT